MAKGDLHHIEVYVSDLARSSEFWGYVLDWLGYTAGAEWEGGRTWERGTGYITLVQTEPGFLDPPYHRKRTGLNHLAFHGGTRAEIDALTTQLRALGTTILYEDRHPFAAGPDYYAVFFEDPDRLKVEVVAEGE